MNATCETLAEQTARIAREENIPIGWPEPVKPSPAAPPFRQVTAKRPPCPGMQMDAAKLLDCGDSAGIPIFTPDWIETLKTFDVEYKSDLPVLDATVNSIENRRAWLSRQQGAKGRDRVMTGPTLLDAENCLKLEREEIRARVKARNEKAAKILAEAGKNAIAAMTARLRTTESDPAQFADETRMLKQAIGQVPNMITPFGLNHPFSGTFILWGAAELAVERATEQQKK